MKSLKRQPLFYILLAIISSLILISLYVRKNDSDQLPSQDNSLKGSLTYMQYYVTQENGTEPAFDNEFFDYKEPGIYVDVVSGEPLFSSTHKYVSKTGWPSFTQPISDDALIKSDDFLLGYKRIEVRSANANSHLGHIFDDGPLPSKKRYCINSAALRFIHKDELKDEGLSEYESLFE